MIRKYIVAGLALSLSFFVAGQYAHEALAADYTIAGSQTTSQVVATGDTVTVTGTGDLNMAAVDTIAIDGRAADNVTVTVQTGGNVEALGGDDVVVSYNTIYLRDNASVTVQAGATVSNAGSDALGDGSIWNTAIVTGVNSTINVSGSVNTNRIGGGFNNWSPGISAGSGSSITVQSGGLVSSDSTGGNGIFLASGGTVTNSGTISSSTGAANTATVCVTAGSSTITNNGTIDSGASGNRAIHFGTAGTETGNTLNLYGSSGVTGMLVNQGVAGGATVNFGYNGSAADGTATTTITGNIGSVNNSWNGRVWGGTSTVVGTTNFNTLQVDSSSTLDLQGASTIAALSGAGTIKNDSASDITITEGDATSTTFSGSIQDGATNKIALTKQGVGALTLSGTNAYTGVTTITAGTISVDTINDGGVAGNLGAATALVANLVFNGGTLQYTGATASTDRGFTINNGKTAVIEISEAASSLSISGGTAATTGSLVKTGAGTLIIGNSIESASYTGTTTISAGTLQINKLGSIGTGAGIINNSALVLNTSGDSGFVNCGISGSGTVAVTSGNLQLRGPGLNTYTGATSISSGAKLIFQLNSVGPSSSAFTVDGTLELNGYTNAIGSLAGSGAVIATVGPSSLTAGGDNTSTTFSGVISGGTTSFTKDGTGTLTLTGANTYGGDTTIDAGTLKLGNADTLDTANVTNNATLDVGVYTLDATGTYVQAAGSALNVELTDASTSGKVSYTTGVGTTIDTTSSVYVTAPTSIYVPTGATFTVIEGTGGTIGIPGTITSSNSRLTFTGAESSGDLILTASRSSSGFSSIATNTNTKAVGSVLDNITSPTSDMTTVLNAMEGLSDSQVNEALNSMLPDVSGAILQASQSTLNQLVQSILGHQEYLRNTYSGVSTGSDMLKGFDIWAQGYGSYLHQGQRQLSKGYDATVWGSIVGIDSPEYKDIKVGTCFGFAQDYIRGKDNSNRSDINSYQWTVYGEYSNDAFYLDLSGAFAFNTYDSSRKVAIGGLSERTAKADYSGEQYQLYVEAGYTFNCKKDLNLDLNLNLTPLASFQYQHLYLEKYTESGADSMNLTVKAQNYDLAQTGFGCKFDYPFNTKYGQFVPEARIIWLYDWIGDSQQTTSTFNGGGGSFATNGFDPAQSTWDFGAKMTMYTKCNWTLALNYDFELKDDFYGHYGYANAKYSF